MILTTNDIKLALERGKSDPNGGIHITPLNESNIGPNSIDLTLQPTLLVYSDKTLDTANKNPQTLAMDIPQEGIILQPNVLYLGATNEETYTPEHRPLVKNKSSLKRLGLEVCGDAGYGDVGFRGTWTLELSCIHPIRIYPNMKICQIEFSMVTSIPEQTYQQTGRYNGQAKPQASKGVK